MRIERFSVGILGTNCYLAVNEKTKEIVIVDPGACPKKLMAHVKEAGYKPAAILLTHGHFDHMMGIDGFLEEFPMPVYVHEDEKDAMTDPRLNQSGIYTSGYTFSDAAYVKGGESLMLAGMEFEVIHTPGHTMGCCCYYMPSENVLFSGDTLFQNSVGRTDFENSSASALVRSIKDKLFVLPDETHVYPGHSAETMMGHEKMHNPYV